MGSYKRQLVETDIAGAVGSISDLMDLGAEAREIVDNAPEGLNQTERIQTFEETASNLEYLDEPDVPEFLSELPVKYTIMVSKRRGESRAVRCNNATTALDAAIDVVEEFIESCTEEQSEQRDEAETFRDALREIVDTAESCEFPGMFG